MMTKLLVWALHDRAQQRGTHRNEFCMYHPEGMLQKKENANVPRRL